MKKFTTTFFLLMAMVLLLPTEMRAQGHEFYLLCDDNSWVENEKFKFSKPDQSKEVFEFTLSKTQISSTNVKDGYFYVRVRPYYNGKRWDNNNDICPQNDKDELTSTLSPATLNANNNLAWKVKYDDNATKYTFTLDRTSPSENKIKVVTGSGGGETGTGYYLYCNPGGGWSSASTYCVNLDNELKSVYGKYNVTFTIPSANTGKFYFCVFKGNSIASNWSNAIRPESGTGTGSNNTATSGSINKNSEKVWLYETASTEDVTLTLSLAGVANGAGWTLTKGEITPTVTYTLKYGETEVPGTATDNGVTFKIPYNAYNEGLSFTISDSEGKTYNPSSNFTLANGEPSNCADNGAGSWLCNEQANTNGYTVTLKDGTVKAVWSTTEIIPGSGDNYYLVGNFFTEDGNNINYDRKIFRFDSDGTGNYTLDIPATLTVDCQVIGVKDGVVTVYAPSGAYEIKGDCPNDNLAVSGTLATTTLGDASNKWSFTTRNLTSDGIYTITLSESATKWDIKHNGNKRMAYYLSTMDGATAQPSYTEVRGSLVTINGKPAYDNRYFGYIYLEKDAKCWIISNLLTQFDNGNSELSKTTTKLYYQGNKDGEIGGGDQKAIVFPAGTSPYTPQPFTIGNTTKDLSVMLEYNPTQGHNNGDYSYGLGYEQTVSGRVQKANSTDAAGSSLPEITSMQILGDGVNGTWNAGDAYEMHYNATERCWEATFTTTKAESKENHFRFIANRKLEYNFGEVNTVARVPYLGDDATGVSALPADPNDVQYHAETDGVTHENMTGDDIIFNRPAGVWTVKFYITQELVGEGGKYEYDFKYTINGTPTVNVPVNLTYRVNKFIRSFSYGDNLDLPTDGSVKAYEAYRFEQGDKATKKHGTVYLRRIEYIPANMGVILVGEVPEGSGTFEDGNVMAFNLTKRTAGLVDKNEDLWTLKDSYKNDANWSEWNNYLVGTVTAVNDLGNAEVVDGKVTKRYFGLGHYYATNEYKKTGVGDDYIGFFRYTANAISGANKAYLSIPTATDSKFGYIDFNGQWLDDNYYSPNASNDEISTLSKAGIIFDDIDFDETTAISNVNANEKNVNDGAYYTLQGIKVAKPTRGLYIHNGKKVIIK